VHVDPHVVVVDKPSGVSTVPYDGDETDTLDRRVRDALGEKTDSLGIVHRIDKETSGLVVFARSWLAKKALSAQFRAHTTHRRYLAIVHGSPRAATYTTHIVPNRGDGLRGSLEAKRGQRVDAAHAARLGAQRAVTHVEPLEPLGKTATLISCRLETGRTHQIRIHLSEAGYPLVGERVYVRGFRGAVIAAPRMMLHAVELGFVHPKTEAPMTFQRDPPADFEALVRRLRQ